MEYKSVNLILTKNLELIMFRFLQGHVNVKARLDVMFDVENEVPDFINDDWLGSQL